MPDDLTPIQQWRRNNPDPRLEGRTDEEVARALYQVRGYGERGIDENEFLSRVGAMPSADVAAEPEPETQGDDPGFQMPGLRDMLNTAVATSPLARFAASERLTPEEQEVHAERTLQNATRRRDNILGTPVAPEGMTDDQFRLATGMYREQYDALPESSPERARVDRLVAEQLQAIEREDPERARVRQALGAEQQALIDRVNAGERAQLSSRGDALLGVPRGGVNALIGTAGTIASANEQVYSGLLGRDVAPSETLGYRLSSQAQDFVTGATFKDPMRAHEIPSQVGEAGGQMALIAGTGPIAGTAIGAGMSSDALTRDAVESGANPMQQRISQLGGAALGLTERLVPEGFEQAGRSIANPIMRRATSGATGFVLETGQEGGQSAGQNYIANTLAGYDPDRPTMSGVRDAMIVGGLVGGIAGTVFSGAPAQDDPVANMDDNTLLQTRQQLAQGRNEVWSAQRASGGSTADAVNATAPIVTQLAALDAELERRGVQVPQDPINPINTDISVQDIATGQEPEVFTRQVTGAARRQAERNNRKKPRLDSAESAVQKIEEDLAGLRSRLSSARQAIRGASDPEAAADAALAIEREIARLIDLQSEIANIENAPDNETPAEAQARVARVKQEIQRINDNGSTQARLERELVEAAPQLSRPQAAAVGEALSLPTNHLVGLGVPEREALASNLQFVGAEPGGAEVETARSLYQFVGENALTSDSESLLAAQLRATDPGVTPDQVRRETGWFYGPDGQWRAEISDESAQLNLTQEQLEEGNQYNPAGLSLRETRANLGDILQHGPLFDAYPKMRNMPVRIKFSQRAADPNTENTGGGSYSYGTTGIQVEAGNLDQVKTILLHEVQHAIQHVEQFAPGGGIEQFEGEVKASAGQARADIGKLRRTQVFTRLKDEVTELAGGGEFASAVARKIADLVASPDAFTETDDGFSINSKGMASMNRLMVERGGLSQRQAMQTSNYVLSEVVRMSAFRNARDAVQQTYKKREPRPRTDERNRDTVFDLYFRLTGETEARDTEARANMDDAARAEATPAILNENPGANDYLRPAPASLQITNEAPTAPSPYQNEPARELFQSETTSGLGSHLVGASRRQRVQGNDVVISRDEETRIKQNAKRLKLDPAEIRAHVERRKAAHPVSEGWVEWVYNRSDVNDKGKVTHYAVQVPYAYHTDADGKPFRPTDEGRAAAVSALARKLADEVATVKKRAEENDRAAIVILRQSGWYKEMRIRLRREFGGMGDLFADLLGATSPNTPVRDNWNNAVEALRLATRGDFDNLIEQWEQFYDNVDAMEGQLATYVAEQQQAGLTKKAIKASPEYLQRLDAVRAARTFPDELLPKKSNGNNYGFNGRNVARAMVDLWRVVKNANPDIGRGSTKPKALNFSGNLIGFRQRATIDVWAARLLQRLAKGNRLPSEAEASVKGDMKQDGSTTGMFGFGQDVFSEAVALIRKQNPDDELLSSINDDDLQAVAWFLEKEIWTLDNATNAAGEGGSFEFEADLAGNPDRERIDELRRVIGSSLSTPEQKQEALAELQGMQREVDRFYAGLSIEQSAETQGIDFKPTDGQMVEVSERIRSAIYANDSTEAVVGSKVMSTEGRYGDPERAFDVEFSTRNDYDATGLMAELERIAAENRQDSFFLSRVLEANAQIDPLRHRPGVEIYFREGASIEELQPMLDRLAEAGAQYYTVVVDGRSTSGSRAGAMPKAVGVRLQYVPEFDARYGDPDTNSALTDEQIEAKVDAVAFDMKRMAAAVAEVDGVSFSDVMWYETQVKFSHQYGAQDADQRQGDDASRVSEGVDQRTGSRVWTGQLVREGLEAAERQSDLANNGRAFEASDRWVESWQQPEGGRELNQEQAAPRGSILIPQAGVTADQPVLIKMGKAADITTAIHEGGHYWLEHYREMAQRHDGVRQFYGEMAQAFGFDADPNAVIPTEAHEAFARGAEQFFAEGEAPTPGLQRIFEQFRNWMKAMYDALIAGGNIDLTPERRDIYKQMFGTEPSSQILPRLRRVNVPDNVRQRPAGGIPMADDFDGPITGERLGDMAREIGEMAGFPVREGRLQSSKALGQYNTRSGVIRLRLPEDFTTLVHEIGHALAFKHRDRYRRVMDAVKAEGALLPLTMDVATDPKTMEDEAFAELARTYIEAPAWLETTAPQGLEAFEKEFGEVAPDLLGLMRDLSVRYEAFLNQPSTAAIAGDMVSQGGANGFRGLARDMATKLKAASNSQGLMALSDKIYTSTFDKTTPIARFMERMDQIYEDRTGRRLKVRPSKDARILSRLAANGANTARVWMMEGVIPAGKIDPEGASLADGLQLALGDQIFKEWNAGAVAEFGSYLMSRRMVDEYARWNRGELKRTPDKFTLGEHRQNIKDLEFRNPTFRQAAELIFEWNDNLLKLKRDRGLISQEQFERFQAAHPHYVPLARDVRSGTQGGTGSLNKGPISKRFKGSDRSVINPIESMMRDANQTAQAIWRNETIGAMYDAAQKAGPEAGAWLEELPANEQDAQKVDLKEAYTNAARAADVDERDAALILEAMDQSLDGYTMATIYRMKEARERGEPVIYLWRNGERKMLRLGDTEQAKATYQAITSLGVGEQSYVLLDWMSLPSQFLVGAVTNHPLFVMMNWQRDQLQNWALSDNGFLPGLSGVVGAAKSSRGGVTENRALAFGGTMAGVGASIQRRNVGDQNSWQGFNRNAKLDINDLRKKGYKIRELASWRGIGTALDITESGSRFENASLYFKKAKKAGMSDEDAIVWAMFEANDTMDFSRRGIVFYWMNRFIPFWNAAAQGTEKGLRVATGGSSLRQIHRLMRPIFFGKPMNFTAQEKRDAARALKLWGKLSIMTLPSLAMMLLYHDDPEFQEFSEYIRATRWLFKVNGEWLMIPKPFELATPANILERGMEAQLWEDPTAFDRATRSLMFTMMPPLENPMITTGAELVANKDLYTGAPIVPDDLVGETPEMQYTERTSAYARVLGNVFGVSPLKIEHVVNSFTGNWSRDISLAGDLFDPDSPEKKLTEQFFIRGLFRNPQSGAVTRDDFWNQMSRTGGRLQAVASRYRGFAQEGDAAGGIDYLRSLDPIEARFALSQVHGVRGAGLPPMYRASHPMAVAQPVMVMNGRMRRDLRNNELTRAGTRDRIELAARDRGRAIAILDRLNGIEALDALRLSGFEAYQNRPGFDRAGQMELLREISPQLAREYEMRRSSATGFMYANTENVERVWSNAEREIDRILQDPDRLQGLIRMREAQRLRSEMPG